MKAQWFLLLFFSLCLLLFASALAPGGECKIKPGNSYLCVSPPFVQGSACECIYGTPSPTPSPTVKPSPESYYFSNDPLIKLCRNSLGKDVGGTPIFNYVIEAAKSWDVDVELICRVMKQESSFYPKAGSPAGARGLMQLMPATAKGSCGLNVDELYDPYKNIQCGTRYLSAKLKEFRGNVKLALAAYNAGSGNVKKYNGIPPFRETTNYVARITNGYEGDGRFA
ncbi:lytic transglycosylase domain-containing protein [Candidatus Micrarchaeota archaeon]|nr:lytic transglycosylase domain-containing protein [Candidatus Micrarchaeota archaeon]